jgi:putative oxidoreductase
MPSGRFLLRVTVGGLMMGHGLQKLNGSFGGPGLQATQESMGALGLHPAKQQGLAAALSETIGGGLTAAGFLSPLGPALITGTMLVAIKKVHLKNGVWVSKGGYEYNATLIAAALSLATAGPGLFSLDGLFRRQRAGLRWGAVALALGVGGAAATLAVSSRMQPAELPGGEDAEESSAPESSVPEGATE